MSCTQPYYSKLFKPANKGALQVYEAAKKDMYPQDIRGNKDLYSGETIAWAGIVKNVKLFDSDYGQVAHVIIEHRYFDWKEDHGKQSEIYFLSPRGEGHFSIFVNPKGKHDEQSIRKLIPLDSMVVAVGEIDTKMLSDDGLPIVMLTEYFEFIDKSKYRDDVFDYGREGEEIQRVENSNFWKNEY
jgi:hypothetical protein